MKKAIFALILVSLLSACNDYSQPPLPQVDAQQAVQGGMSNTEAAILGAGAGAIAGHLLTKKAPVQNTVIVKQYVTKRVYTPSYSRSYRSFSRSRR